MSGFGVRRWWPVLGFLVGVACGDSSTPPDRQCEQGAQDCSCILGTMCQGGLVCVNDMCLPVEMTTGPTTTDGSASGSSGGSSATTNGTTTMATGGSGASTGPASTGGATGDGSTGGMMGQPATGMYSDCFAGNCTPGDLTCVDIVIGLSVVDAYCSDTDCQDPGEDCDAAPGGTAVPMCLIGVGNPAEDVCALDCSGGRICPTGMMCYDIGGGLMVCS